MSVTEGFQKTIERYHDLIRQNPDDVGLLTNLAWSYERAGQYQEAIQHFRRASELNPQDYNVYYGLGLALMGHGQRQEALKAFLRARDLAHEGTDHSTMVIVAKQVESISHRLKTNKRR